MIDALISLVILSVISACVGLMLTDNWFSFLRTFVVTSIIQVVIYSIYKQMVVLMAEKIKNDRIKEYSKQGIESTCPCSRAVRTFIPIRLDADNSYKCLDCAKYVAVNVDVKTFLSTEPINIDKSNAALDMVYNQITNPDNDNQESDEPHTI